MYRRWPRLIGDVEVCPVQPPGRESRLREEPYGTYEELADALAEVLLPYLDVPFGFFGHCASALAGYQTAVTLQRHGYPTPARVFVSSQVPPHRGPHGRFLTMTEDELRAEVTVLIKELGGQPRTDLVELSLGVLRADVAANKRYRPAAAAGLSCPITALGWRDDVEVDHRLMGDWADLAETAFRLLDGGHYRFVAGPPELLDVLQLDLGTVGGMAGR